MVRFGQTAEEFSNSYSGDDIWIKGFKDGSTRIRFLQPTKDFITYREHYSDGPGYFPCSENTATCPGCNDESEKVRQRNRRYAVNCLGESGRIDIHKMGSRLYKVLKAREQRLDTIMDRDYTIIRSGKMLDTVYEVEPGDRYPLEGDPGELHDIPAILGAKYQEALEAYGLAESEPDTDPAPTADSQTVAARETAAAQATEESSIGTPAADAPAAPANELDAIHSGFKPVEQTDTPVIREFLDKHGVEYPPKAPRSRLITLANDWIAKNPPF